uniref:Tubulin polyglutamylase TTLL4 n=1 Tax=Steinernema glaseri TaxID=37863 RepID=A0A1I8AM10_9BILA
MVSLRGWPRPTTWTVLLVLLLGVGLISVDIYVLRQMQAELLDRKSGGSKEGQVGSGERSTQPVAWVNGKNMKTGYLSHVIEVLDRLGYKIVTGNQTLNCGWDVLWNHEYPFNLKMIKPHIAHLRQHQKVNHVPGSGYYTSKVSLATANVSDGIPPAFKLPEKREDFEAFAKAHSDFLWVQKSNKHRGIQIRKVSELDLDQKDSFVQQYISNPLLIDKRKFDIGIYTVITSILPLRVYIYEGDALLRFCPQNYHPFDEKVPDKYVVGDDYTPTWEMPSLKKYYVDQSMTFRESLNAYLQAQGKDPEKIWSGIRETIRQVFESQQHDMAVALKKHKFKHGFFELSRFDFVVDSELRPYLMEANMSPNLSSGHFKPNKLLYEQVLFNIFSLVGVARHVHGHLPREDLHNNDIIDMQVSDRDLRVLGNECVEGGDCFQNCKAMLKCRLCEQCILEEDRAELVQAYLEHVSKGAMRRILPSRTIRFPKIALTQIDRLQTIWFDRKCKLDSAWCH